MTMNLRSDDTFVEDEGWHKAAEHYSLFLQRHQNQNIVYLELGVGYNTPVIIKYPFTFVISQLHITMTSLSFELLPVTEPHVHVTSLLQIFLSM